MGFFDAIASAFEDAPPAESSLADIDHFQQRMDGAAASGVSKSSMAEPAAKNFFGRIEAGIHSFEAGIHSFEHRVEASKQHLDPAEHMRPGMVYVHAQRMREALPTVPPPPQCGVAQLDADFRRRSDQLVQEMSREFSGFSLTGLAAAEQTSRVAHEVQAARAAEDRALAARRREEDLVQPQP